MLLWYGDLFSSVQLLSRVWLFETPWTAGCQASLSINNSQSLLKPMTTESVMPSKSLILCRPLLLLLSHDLSFPWSPSFPWSGSFPMSQFFTSSGQSIGISASASVPPKNIQDWFPLWLTVWSLCLKGTFRSKLQNHSSKASILQCSAFFIFQLTSIHDYWKNHSLD